MVVSRRRIAARAALKGSLVAALLCLGAPSAADPLDPWALDIAEASSRFGVPTQWIRRVITIESGGHARIEGRPVVSRAGAMGLMQLMPDTWRSLRSQLNLGPDPFQPRDNILAGTAYLRLMYDRFGYPGLFAAYNAGPGRYSAWLSSGRALPAETRAYVLATAPAGRSPSVARRPPPDRLFAMTADLTASAPGSAAGIARGLFVELDRSPGR